MKSLTLRYLRDLILCAAFILSVKSLLAVPAGGYPAFPTSIHSELPQETVVYTTKTGSKYHRDGCRYLKQSKIKTTVKKAVKDGNGACKVCKP